MQSGDYPHQNKVLSVKGDYYQLNRLGHGINGDAYTLDNITVNGEEVAEPEEVTELAGVAIDLGLQRTVAKISPRDDMFLQLYRETFERKFPDAFEDYNQLPLGEAWRVLPELDQAVRTEIIGRYLAAAEREVSIYNKQAGNSRIVSQVIRLDEAVVLLCPEVPGTSLQRLSRKFTIKNVVDIIAAMLTALDEFHNLHGRAHGDLTSENILISGFERGLLQTANFSNCVCHFIDFENHQGLDELNREGKTARQFDWECLLYEIRAKFADQLGSSVYLTYLESELLSGDPVGRFQRARSQQALVGNVEALLRPTDEVFGEAVADIEAIEIRRKTRQKKSGQQTYSDRQWPNVRKNIRHKVLAQFRRWATTEAKLWRDYVGVSCDEMNFQGRTSLSLPSLEGRVLAGMPNEMIAGHHYAITAAVLSAALQFYEHGYWYSRMGAESVVLHGVYFGDHLVWQATLANFDQPEPFAEESHDWILRCVDHGVHYLTRDLAKKFALSLFHPLSSFLRDHVPRKERQSADEYRRHYLENLATAIEENIPAIYLEDDISKRVKVPDHLRPCKPQLQTIVNQLHQLGLSVGQCVPAIFSLTQHSVGTLLGQLEAMGPEAQLNESAFLVLIDNLPCPEPSLLSKLSTFFQPDASDRRSESRSSVDSFTREQLTEL